MCILDPNSNRCNFCDLIVGCREVVVRWKDKLQRANDKEPEWLLRLIYRDRRSDHPNGNTPAEIGEVSFGVS